MSYLKQVICYACAFAASTAASTVPSAADEAAFNLTGWNSTGFLSHGYAAWSEFSSARLLGGASIVKAWLANSSALDANGRWPYASGAEVSGLKSLAAAHWGLATGENTPEALCASNFGCPEHKTRRARTKIE